jgi:Phage integrase, N-terminal SAM-like domain
MSELGVTAPAAVEGSPSPRAAPRLLEVFTTIARSRGHPPATVSSFADWIRRFILYHNKRHPRELGLAEIGRFLNHVARQEKEPLAALDAARDALAMLYRDVLRPRWRRRDGRRDSARQFIAIRFGTASPPILWSAGSIYGRFRCCSGTTAWRRR